MISDNCKAKLTNFCNKIVFFFLVELIKIVHFYMKEVFSVFLFLVLSLRNLYVTSLKHAFNKATNHMVNIKFRNDSKAWLEQQNAPLCDTHIS